jgi:hypothetical protein
MNYPETIVNAAKVIGLSSIPVLLLDTCAVLDIIRAPQRKEIQNDIIAKANEIVFKSITDPKQLWIVKTTLVDQEWLQHYQETKNQREKYIKDVDERSIELRDVSQHLPLFYPILPLEFRHLKIPDSLQNLATSLIDSSFMLAEDTNCILQARQRFIDKRPPSTKGNQQYKDCQILEHYLAFCRELRKNGYQEKCVFVSSNTNDYCENRKLHPILKAEFDVFKLEYARNIAHAHALLKP